MSSWYDYFLDSITPQEFKPPKKRTSNILLDPEPPPTYETKLSESGLGTESLALSDRSAFAGLPQFSTVPIKPKPPKHPTVQQIIGEPIAKAGEWALTPQLPKEEAALMGQAEKLGYIPSLLADYYVEGSSSPIGILGNLPAIGLPAKAGLTAAAKIASSLGGAKGGAALAGMPFFKLAKKVGLQEINAKPVMFRGDPGVTWGNKPTAYEYINPQYYNRQDTLGWMTHMGEEPKYPERSYAYKHGSPYPPTQMESHSINKAARPNVTALTSTAENAIDLTRIPEGEDFEALIRGLEQWNPARSPFGSRDRLTRDRTREIIKQLPAAARKQAEADLLKAEEVVDFNQNHPNWDLQNRESLMVDARGILNDPKIAEKIGWDAIRYDDMGHMSWAFPDIGKLETPWGTKIGRSSMGQYPYKLSFGGEEVGHFATPAEAAKKAIDSGKKLSTQQFGINPTRGDDADIYLGAHLISTPDLPGFSNKTGLGAYLESDKTIQNKLLPDLVNPERDKWAQSIYGTNYNALTTSEKININQNISGKPKAGQPPTDLFSIAVANNIAKENFGKPYGMLSNKEQHDVFQAWEMGKGKSKVGIKPGDDFTKLLDDLDELESLEFSPLDEEFEKATGWSNPSQVGGKIPVHPDLADTIKHKISIEDYGDYFHMIDKEGKQNVNDILDDILSAKNTDDIDQVYKNYPSMKNELDQLYGSKSSIEVSSPINTTLNELNKDKYGVKTYKVTEEDLHKFAGKGSALDPISEQYYGKKYEDLAPGESDWVWDVSTAALDLEKSGLIKSDVPFTGTNKPLKSISDIAKEKYGQPFDELTDTQKMKVWDDLKSESLSTNKLKEAAAKVGSGKLNINQVSQDMYGKPVSDLSDKEYNNVVAIVKKSEKAPPALDNIYKEGPMTHEEIYGPSTKPMGNDEFLDEFGAKKSVYDIPQQLDSISKSEFNKTYDMLSESQQEYIKHYLKIKAGK